MMESIIVAIITGGMALIGVVVTNIMANNKMTQAMTTSQAVTDTKLEELTREVREHNGFAQKIPALEKDVEFLKGKVKELEGLHKRT